MALLHLKKKTSKIDETCINIIIPAEVTHRPQAAISGQGHQQIRVSVSYRVTRRDTQRLPQLIAGVTVQRIVALRGLVHGEPIMHAAVRVLDVVPVGGIHQVVLFVLVVVLKAAAHAVKPEQRRSCLQSVQPLGEHVRRVVVTAGDTVHRHGFGGHSLRRI